jgi:hypothetical protein
MTVAELIAEASKYDPGSIVCLSTCCDQVNLEMVTFAVHPNGDRVLYLEGS